jgi:hypothetical protein
MLQEHDLAALTRDLDDYGLKMNDVGAVVHRYGNSEALEVEFVAADGSTIALLTLITRDVRPILGHEILHVRPLTVP